MNGSFPYDEAQIFQAITFILAETGANVQPNWDSPSPFDGNAHTMYRAIHRPIDKD